MFRTVHYQVCTKSIKKQLNVVHLSDLHGARHGTHNQQITDRIRLEKPDLAVMTGDMGDERDKSFDELCLLCGQLTSICPVYYVPGNHEQRFPTPKLDTLLCSLSRLGVTCLYNESQLLSVRGNTLRIYGLVTPMEYYRDLCFRGDRNVILTGDLIGQLLGPCDSNTLSLLLAHNPLHFKAYQEWGASVVLSGHIHGGIIRLPYLGGLLSPEFKFFPRYDGGHFAEHGRHLIVSRGLGNNFAFRINNPAELVFLKLLPVHEKG